MSVINPAVSFRPLAIVVLIAICASCQTPEPVPDNRYQRTIENTSSVNTASLTSTSQAVIQLQNQALAAINEDQYQQAINYLQRAIKIQPRNAWSWHFLAQTYWHSGQSDRCLAMIDRSQSYVDDDDELDSANERLRMKCQQG